MLPIKAVLFDLDDTLWPVLPVITRAEALLYDWLQQHAPAVAARFSIEELRTQRQQLMANDPIYQIDLSALRHRALCNALESVGDDIAKVDQAMQVFTAARNDVALFADVRPTLEWLHHRVPLGVISNGTADLHTIGLAQYFDTIVSAPRVGCAKPGAAIFHLACDALRIDPRHALYIGDDPLLDVAAAQRVGMRTIWIDRFARKLPLSIRPDAQLQSLNELPSWLQQHEYLSQPNTSSATASPNAS